MPATTIREMLLEAMAAQGESWADFICHDVTDELFNSDPYDGNGPLTFHAWTRKRVYSLVFDSMEAWAFESVTRDPPATD